MNRAYALSIWLTLAGMLALPGASGALAATEKELHLMYLVAAKAGDLKPGSQVAVEPVFFTDGKRIVFAYDYCDARWNKPGRGALTVFEKANLLRQSQVVDDLAPINSWCNDVTAFNERGFKGTTVPVKADGLVAVDHEGSVLKLSSITLNGSDQLGRGVVRSLSDPVDTPPPLRQRLYRFFLLGSDQDLLRQLVPTSMMDPGEAVAFAHSLDPIKSQSRGTVHVLCTPRRTQVWCERRRSTKFDNTSVDTASWFVSDIDQDGVQDFVAGLRALVAKTDYLPFLWQGIAVVRAGKSPWVRGNTQFVEKSAKTALGRYGEFLYLPMLAIRTRDCSYLLSITSGEMESLSLLSVRDEMQSCSHRSSYKRIGQGD